jgi:hypothetical protein
MPILLSLDAVRLDFAQSVAKLPRLGNGGLVFLRAAADRLVRPVLKFALPIVLAIALLAGFLSPWANQRRAEYKQTALGA